MLDINYLIERLDAEQGQTAESLLRSFFKLLHRFEKAVGAVEAALDALGKVDPDKAAVMRSAWGEGEKLRECIQAMDKALATLLHREE